MDYYRLLQVSPDADLQIIKAAFRTIMSRMSGHPDRGGDADTARQLVEAYAVLSDPERRRAYDASLRRAAPTKDDQPEPPADRRSLPPAYAAPADSDRRSWSRMCARVEVFVRRPEGEARPAALTDISHGGACLAVDDAFALRDRVEIATDANALPFSCAEIVDVREPGREYGLRWLWIHEGSLATGLLQESIA